MSARRGLVVCVLLALAAAALAAAAPAHPQSAQFPQGAAAGDVTQDTATVWTRAPEAADVRVLYSTEAGFTGARSAGPFRPMAEADFVVKADLTDLQPGQRYYYRVATTGSTGPSGTFVTAPAPDSDAGLSLIWGADTYENYKPFRVFQAMRSRDADAFLFLGDTIYSDLGQRALTVEQYREKYKAYREDNDLRAYLTTTSTWVVWDDHEVDNNFSSDHPRLGIGLQALLEYWPIRAPADQPRRLYRRLPWGRLAELFILDTRQYRTRSSLPDGPAKTMLGDAQKQWLLEGLTRSAAVVKIVASSVVLRHHGNDSWAGFTRERDEILGTIRSRGIANVIFLAADVHYAALIQHPEGVHEAIASPLAAFAGTPRAAGRPGTLWAAGGRSNYGWMRLAPDAVTVGWWDDQNGPMHEARIPVTR